jgi:hypothetical protein
MDARKFIKPAKVILVAAMLMWNCAFGCSTVIGLLNDAKIGVDGVLPIVELADPAIAPAVQVGVTAFDNGVIAADDYYNAYEAALKAGSGTATTEQKLADALAALRATSAQILAAAQVKDPAHMTLIQDIMNAVSSEILNVANLFVPVTATASANVRVTTAQNTDKALKAERTAFRAKMKSILSRTTGDAALDANIHALAKKY